MLACKEFKHSRVEDFRCVVEFGIFYVSGVWILVVREFVVLAGRARVVSMEE